MMIVSMLRFGMQPVTHCVTKRTRSVLRGVPMRSVGTIRASRVHNRKAL